MKGKRILIIDDDQEIVKLTEIIFESAEADVVTATSGKEGLRLLWQSRPDLVVLDVMMPQMSGWELCERIRELTDIPIIFLTGRHKEEDIVRGFSLGADDYVVKPMNPNLLLARASALLRRQESAPTATFAFDDGYLRVDLKNRQVAVESRLIKLTPTEYDLLSLLVRNAGRITTTAQIKQQVWGGSEQVSPETIHVFISQVRKKIEPDPRAPRYIVNEYSVGYRFP